MWDWTRRDPFETMEAGPVVMTPLTIEAILDPTLPPPPPPPPWW